MNEQNVVMYITPAQSGDKFYTWLVLLGDGALLANCLFPTANSVHGCPAYYARKIGVASSSQTIRVMCKLCYVNTIYFL